MRPERTFCVGSHPCQGYRRTSCNGWDWVLLSTGSLKFRQWEPDGANGEILWHKICLFAKARACLRRWNMTRRTRNFSAVLCLLCAAMVAGCPGDRMSRSTTEAVDDSLIANKVTLALYSDKQVSGKGIAVEASQGIVELTG